MHVCYSNNLCSQFSSLCCAESHHSPPVFRPPSQSNHTIQSRLPAPTHTLSSYPQSISLTLQCKPPRHGTLSTYNDPWPPPYIDDWCPAVAPYPTLCYDDRKCSSEKHDVIREVPSLFLLPSTHKITPPTSRPVT